MTPDILAYYFKTFQVANFLAAFALLFEIFSILPKRIKSKDWNAPTVSFKMVCIGAVSAATIPVMTFTPRIFESKVVYFSPGHTVPITANIATTLLFLLLFWFRHMVCIERKGEQRSMMQSWRSEHLTMIIILVVSVLVNAAEWFRGGM